MLPGGLQHVSKNLVESGALLRPRSIQAFFCRPGASCVASKGPFRDERLLRGSVSSELNGTDSHPMEQALQQGQP